jgi:hypothetical protein
VGFAQGDVRASVSNSLELLEETNGGLDIMVASFRRSPPWSSGTAAAMSTSWSAQSAVRADCGVRRPARNSSRAAWTAMVASIGLLANMHSVSS